MNRSSGSVPSELILSETTVLGQEQIVKDVFLLRLKKKDEFIAGQFVALALELKGTSRLYSIASGPSEPYIDLLYDVKPEGLLTPKMQTLQKGDKVYISKPFGSFLGDEKPAWWIAAGTGIAPFASMFFSGFYKNKTLIHGGKTRNSFYFEKDFLPRLRENYIRCCSQETGEGLYQGRLTKYLSELKEIPADQKYYLCGSVEMVVDVRDILISRGIPYSNILAEIFF
jgi:ferredoxin/flavodoxin---NADP+ reductase